MTQVTFKSQEHYDLILRQVFKLYDHKNRTSPREIRRKEMEYKLLKSILTKMQPPPASPAKDLSLEVRFSRQELRAIQSLCIQGRMLLNTHIIPGYEERIKKEEKEDVKASYQGYIDRAGQADGLYADILKEVEAAL